jgi:hypothetical protein
MCLTACAAAAAAAAGALLLDPFKTMVPAAAFPQPAASVVSQLSLLDAHCGSFQQVRAA